MRLLNFFENHTLEYCEAIAIYDMNLTSPLYIGLAKDVTWEYLRRDVSKIQWVTDATTDIFQDKYKGKELYYTIKITLIS